jgi:orotidine-5'-phosphate decarboxylase
VAVVTTPALILALDVATAGAAHALLDRLDGRCQWCKVGLELFTAEGPALVRAIRARNIDVFLDLKLHDIPHTVQQAAARAADLDVRLLTVHASGGRAMLDAAVHGAGTTTGVLGVTVLTSFTAEGVAAAWGRGDGVDVSSEVARLATFAAEAGAHGVVCSGQELGVVRAIADGRLAPLVPGIRLAGGATHDQARVVTPAEAAAGGARYLILGRAVTAAPEPTTAWAQIEASLSD